MARRVRGEPREGEYGPPKPVGIKAKEFHLKRMKDLRGQYRRFETPEEEPVVRKKAPYRLRPRPPREYD